MSLSKAFAVATVLAASQAHAQSYTIQTFDVPTSALAGPVDYVSAINNAGHIAGQYLATPYEASSQGAYYADKTGLQVIRTATAWPGSIWIGGIDANNDVFGSYSDQTTGTNRGFEYHSGQFTPIDYATGENTVITGASSGGAVVGFHTLTGYNANWFVLNDGVAQDLPTAPNSQPLQSYYFGINDHGLLVGYYQDVNFGVRGFLYNSANGQFLPLDDPRESSSFTVARGINDKGEVVGYYQEGYTFHGFTYANGNFDTFDVPNSNYTAIFGINDQGDLVGAYRPVGTVDVVRGFVATPEGFAPPVLNPTVVPEPATWAMLILGLGMIGFAARRRNAGVAVAA